MNHFNLVFRLEKPPKRFDVKGKCRPSINHYRGFNDSAEQLLSLQRGPKYSRIAIVNHFTTIKWRTITLEVRDGFSCHRAHLIAQLSISKIEHIL